MSTFNAFFIRANEKATLASIQKGFEKMEIDQFRNHFMKTTIHILTAICPVLLVTGCKPSHRVNFKPPNVSIDPGVGWKQLNIPVELPACSPRLISKAGMINAVFLEDFTEVNKAADFLQARFSTGRSA